MEVINQNIKFKENIDAAFNITFNSIVGDLALEVHSCKIGASCVCLDNFYFDTKVRKMKAVDFYSIDQRIKSYDNIIIEKYGRKLNN